MSKDLKWSTTLTQLILICICLVKSLWSFSCDKGICAPANGNLIIGRERNITATSTCGLTSQEKFCVVTSLDGPKNCYWCHSNVKNSRRESYHGIENLVAPALGDKKPWWQSQNGVENVTIQLNLETIFYFSFLYIKFKTFRPAGMVVERSSDFGLTWQAYWYFAKNCSKQYPEIPIGEHMNLTMPYCTERYSVVTPFENGEVILRSLPPGVENIIDPFSDEVQNRVKFTNLRINFTKLHTLGDDLLDNRLDIKEKYYFAIYEMIVGGTCACFGHANQCLPMDGVESKPGMVHGKCECTHNTKGLNCESCEDLYNDLKWFPAIGKTKNICKKCNCNNHATSCHFDLSVFESTGRVSGGVCDNCLHNTMGRNCEQCKHFYYQDPYKDFTYPDVCLQCDCDPAGSLDEGICDSRTDAVNGLISGQCHCKQNIDGRRCDTCKNGFWNLTEANPLGCNACSCNIFGTYENQGCNKDTGECTCKRNVLGRDCNQCVSKYWGLSNTPEGCKPCDCDPGGSLDERCDVISGQCRCHPNITGRTCDTPKQSFFSRPLGYVITEAEKGSTCIGNCIVEPRAPFPEYGSRWTGPGFVRINSPTMMYFPMEPVSVDLEFNPVVRYEPQSPDKSHTVELTLIRPDNVNPSGYCVGKIGSDVRQVVLRSDSYQVVGYPPFCLEANKNYTVKLEFKYTDRNPNSPQASILIDSILMIPHIESIPFMRGSPIGQKRQHDFTDYRCADAVYSVVNVNLSEICRSYHYSIGAYIHGGAYPCECDSTGSSSSICDQIGGSCTCKPNVVGRKCNYCTASTYGFGPEGCKACDCHNSGALDNFCDVQTGQCKCRPQTYGRSCDLCQPGYWNYPNCQRCICHGHADICDQRSGACIDCQNATDGSHCDRCKDGYYGDPRIGVDIACRKCPCPGTSDSGQSFADSCLLDPHTQGVVCECKEGYSGARCELCSENYFGSPEKSGGSCLSCNCSNNIDITSQGNCDSQTGQCLKCLYNTDGFNCEHCKSGYYGDAQHQSCRDCVCDILGTDHSQGSCDRVTGQCPCLPNVTRLNCDSCAPNHWKIASGAGCEACDCDPNGSQSDQCNQYDGQCSCKPEFGGRRCDQCQNNFWGDPKQNRCLHCECNLEGSFGTQCNQMNGFCNCRQGIGGAKCDQCARGYLGKIPSCDACGECFDNWDSVLADLKEQTKSIAEKATEIMKTGASGSYVNEFDAMEKKLNSIQQILQNTSASSQQLHELEKKIEDVRVGILSADQLNEIRIQAENVTQRVTLASLALNDTNWKMNNLNQTTHNLKENATKLQEGNVEGALNLTRDAYERAKKLKGKNEATEQKANEAKQTCKRTENFITRHGSQFTKELEENYNQLQNLNDRLNELESEIPSLNKKLCGKDGNPCDNLCGGAGCGICGGLSCDQGALTKAEGALKFVKEAEKEIKNSEINIGELYRGVSQAHIEAKNALKASQIAQQTAETVKNELTLALNHTSEMIKQLEDFTNNSAFTPAQIRKKAEETMQKTIQLRPSEISDLGQKINDTVSSLTNIDAIIHDTDGDLKQAVKKKEYAVNTLEKAKNMLNVTENVLSVLEQADQSQKMAGFAIECANSNISQAKKSLSEISQTSIEGLQNTNSTLQQFANLENDFKTLQTEFLKNSENAKSVENELTDVSKNVDETMKKTRQITYNYKLMAEELDRRSVNSSIAYNSSQELSEKASTLFLNAKEKLKELSDYETIFSQQDKNLSDIDNKLKSLTEKIKLILEDMTNQSNYYETCT